MKGFFGLAKGHSLLGSMGRGIGITSFAYRWAVRQGGLNVFELLERAKKDGAEVVQICDNLPLETQPEETIKKQARRAGELGLTLEVGIKEGTIDPLRRAHHVVNLLGARLLRVAGAAPEGSPSVDQRVENIGALLRIYEARGWRLPSRIIRD